MSTRLGSRSVFDLRKYRIASVPVFGRYKYNRASPALAEHRHAHTIEICYLEKGRQIYCVGQERFLLRGGDIFLTYPGETHSTGGTPEEKGLLYWLNILDPSLTHDTLLGLDIAHSRALWNRLRRSRHRHFAGSPAMRRQLYRIAKLSTLPRSRLITIEMTNCLVGFILSLIEIRTMAAHPNRQPGLDLVLQYVESNLDQPDKLSISRMAEVMSLSPSRFKAAFKEQTGIPPAEFVLRARVEEAQRRLQEGQSSVTEVAYGLGFSSSQYFASVFKRYTGLTPRCFVGRI